MKIEQTTIKDLVIIHPEVHEDSRGYFFEAYNKEKYIENGIQYNFIQDNQSYSKRGVIRGLHLQMNPHAQAKLVRVLEGEILDVAVDLRKKSDTFGQYFSIILSNNNRKQLMIPPGFAHGFSVQSDFASVLYKVDASYNRDCERGLRYDDPAFHIDWKVNPNEIVVSEKDVILPFYHEINLEF